MPELSHRRRLLVLAICCMSLLIVGLDNTVLNAALPAIQRDLDTDVAGLQWTIDGYTLVIASLLMFGGSTADRIGRRRVFQTGLVVFTVASGLCSLAHSLPLLVVFRMVQAIGGSMLSPVAMSIITNTFTDPRERARAIGVWSGVFGISMVAGPLVGGLLVDSVGWRSIFWLNLPVGLAALLLTMRFVPESRSPKPRRPDPVGQLLVIVLLSTLTYAIIDAPEAGIGSPRVLGPALVAVAALATLIWYEPRRAQPLIDVRFFRSAPFSGATAIAVSSFAALCGFLFLNTLYLQDVRGLSALHAGLWMLPMAAFMGLCAPVSGRIVGSRGPRISLLTAGAALTASGALFAVLGIERSTATLLIGYVLFGFGFGFVNAPITNTAVSGMPRAQAGVAAAVASTSRQIGATLGVAVIGAVLASGGGGAGAEHRAAFGDASGPAWWIITGCGLVVLLLGAVTTGPWARGTARRTAERLTEPEEQPQAPGAAQEATEAAESAASQEPSPGATVSRGEPVSRA